MKRHPPNQHAHPDYSALVVRVRSGCEDAARELIDDFQPRVLGLVRLHLPFGEDPADVAQDVFVKVFTKLDQYRDASPLWSWISQITVRTCIDQIRARQRRPVVRWSDLSDTQRDALENWHDRGHHETRDIDAAEVVERLLNALDPQDRMLVRLLDLEQKTPVEVAETTGWSNGLVRVKAFRARKRLKILYQKLENSSLT